MRRAFVVTVVVAGLSVVVTLAAALGLTRALAGCYVSWVPLQERPMCGSQFWGHWLVPFGILAVAGVTLVSSVVVAVRTTWQQFVGAHAYARVLGVHVVRPPTRLAACIESVSLSRVTCVASEVPIAVTVGVWRPRVLVTDALVGLLSDAELEAVLVHEKVHVLRRHPAVYGLARVAARATFVLPVVRAVATRVVLESELEADAAAVHDRGRRSLVGALAKLSATRQLPDPVAVGSIQGMLDDRVQALAGVQPDRTLPRALLAPTICGVALLAIPAALLGAAYLRAQGAF